MIGLVKQPVNNFEIVSTSDIGRQSRKVAHSSFFGIKTVREDFQAVGIFLYFKLKVNILESAWLQGR